MIRLVISVVVNRPWKFSYFVSWLIFVLNFCAYQKWRTLNVDIEALYVIGISKLHILFDVLKLTCSIRMSVFVGLATSN